MTVAVLGAGVTGLTAAWKLAQGGHTVKLFEASNRLGGSIRTESFAGWTVESGAHSFREDSPETRELIRELGLESERMEPASSEANRYVLRKGAWVAVPRPSLDGLAATPLLSLEAKLRVALEATRRPRTHSEDVSVAEWVRSHFGNEVLERIAQPFVSGIYAGDPERLSVRYAFPKRWEAERVHGSLVRAAASDARERRSRGVSAVPAVVSFRRGLQALPDAIAARIPSGSVVLNADVRSIAPGSQRRWRLSGAIPGDSADGQFDWVLCALPASALASLEIGGGGKRPLSDLAAIEYPPVASLFLGFRREDVGHPLDGFGALIPAVERRSILGIIFVSSLFPGRAPDGHVAVNVLAGGALDPRAALASSEAMTQTACRELRDLLAVRGAPVIARHTLWPKAIPQYNLGYGRFLDAMAVCEKAHPGIAIGGSVRGGISIPECLLSGSSLAARVS